VTGGSIDATLRLPVPGSAEPSPRNAKANLVAGNGVTAGLERGADHRARHRDPSPSTSACAGAGFRTGPSGAPSPSPPTRRAVDETRGGAAPQRGLFLGSTKRARGTPGASTATRPPRRPPPAPSRARAPAA
jgi:hypothetical protein